MARAPAIGIDLGTSYSRVCFFDNGKVKIIPCQNGDRKIPSYVAFAHTGRSIGSAAKNQIATIVNPENIIFDTKRLIGRKFEDFAVSKDSYRWPFEVKNPDSKPKIEVEFYTKRKSLRPDEISSMILMEMIEIAEAHLGETVTDAVISVPANFNNSKRQATIDAGNIAGLNVLGIVNGPSAAALAYGFHNRNEILRHVLIFDLGGGSLDVSILSVEDGIIKVESTAGDPNLGGADFDNRMIDYFLAEFKLRHKKDLWEDKRALLLLKVACEKAKRSLSSLDLASIEIDSLHEGIDFYSCMTRTKFENLNADLFDRVLIPVEKSIHDAKIVMFQIDEIILVGGSTKIPKIRELLQNFFKGRKLYESPDAEEMVAYGAAIQAAIKQSSLSGQYEQLIADMLLIDVTPSSLCIETFQFQKNQFISKNTTIPIDQTFSFYSSRNQTAELITIYESEEVTDAHKNLLGKFYVRDISPFLNTLEITLKVDANGVLNVTAEEVYGNTRKKLFIKSNKDD